MSSQTEDTAWTWAERERSTADAIVNRINAERAHQKITIRDLAAKLQTHGWPIEHATLNGILSGYKRQTFGVSEVLAFAEALDVPVTDIFQFEDPRRTKKSVEATRRLIVDAIRRLDLPTA